MVLGQGLASALTYVHSPPEESHLYTFSGYISTVGHYSRLHQYIFLNNRPVLCDNLLRLVTLLFQQSSFSKDSGRDAESDDIRRSREKHPVFVLMLICPTSQYNICTDPSKVAVEFEVDTCLWDILFRVHICVDFILIVAFFLGRTTCLPNRQKHCYRVSGAASSALSVNSADSTPSNWREKTKVKAL